MSLEYTNFPRACLSLRALSLLIALFFAAFSLIPLQSSLRKSRLVTIFMVSITEAVEG